MAAADVLEVLEARELTVSKEVRERVSNSAELDQLRRWLRRAAVITTADELFDE